MEDSRFQLDTIMSTDTNVDFDLMDELLSGGCWLETTQEGSDFLQPTTSSSNSTFFFNSSYFLPTTTTTSDALYPNPLQNNKQDNPDGSSLVPRIHTSLQPQAVTTSNGSRCLDTAPMAERFGQSECQKTEGSFELADKWWIEPNNSNSAAVSSVKARLIQALKLIKDSIRSGDVLIQIWIPVKRGGKQFLITTDQPFTSSQRLECYRNASMRYQFPAEEGSNESVGLPGRVFLGKVPEWTPDVRFFSSEEYPRIDHAQRYDVRGTLALPIFERCSRSCLGVVEVVMTTQKVNYRPELENVCRALEAVNLRGSEVASPSFGKVPNVSYQAVLPEIHEVLRAVCETHRLPLAQTWVPCILQGKEGCRHSDENYARCVSTVDSACCVTDPRILGFHEACSEHHLFRGQGVAGRAFTTNQPCFSSDITSFSKKDYPLSHYARMFGLRAAVAIRLRSLYTGTSDYVLELFLPVECCDSEEQKMMLSSLSNIIQRVCQSLRVVTDKELQEDTILTNIELAEISNQGPNREQMPKMVSNPSKGSSEEETSWITQLMEVQRKGKSFQKEEPTTEGFKVTTQWNSPELVLQKGQPFGQNYHESGPKDNTDSGGDSSFGDRRISSASKTGEKRRTKMEKTISLQVLRQYFAGSLKDAAKSIGVCPTTLKRICRQHGITRWPSRKIKKVGHSLRKLQVVIDSVQGAEGAFQIGSIYANFPELTSPNLSGNSRFSKSQANDQSNLTNVQPEGVSSPQGAASKSSSSSGSQSSNNSSLSCSSENQQIPATTNLASEDALMAEITGSIQKRTCSVAEMHSTDQENSGLLARSQSHRCVTEHPSPNDSFPPLPSNNRVCRDRSSLRVKVTYGEEKVRFSLQLSWGFSDLQEEIAKRFYIDDMSRMDLKYLDDDSEWVLLTCDADLEECMDIYKSSQTETIKLTVNQASHPNLGSSLGSTAP